MTGRTPDILCIGSVLWDVIGRTPAPMPIGSDVPGRIERIPGGVALNLAMALCRFGLSPAVLSAVGDDAEGAEIRAFCAAQGITTDFLHTAANAPTDRYMAVESAGGLVAAIADAHTLEGAGTQILAPLRDGRLGSAVRPYEGCVVLDGNLTTGVLRTMADSAILSRADLRVVPASPGKADRVRPFLPTAATLYLNLEEAAILADQRPADSREAAEALMAQGANRVLVTDGARDVTEGSDAGFLTLTPPGVEAVRVTGAGDMFMAAHITAELAGAGRQDALETALDAAARFVAGETP